MWIIAKSRGLPVLTVYDAIVGIDVAQGHPLGTRRRTCPSFCVPSPSARPRKLVFASSMRLLIRAILGMNWRMWRLITSANQASRCFLRCQFQRFLENIEQFSWMWMLFLSSEQGSALPEVIDGRLVVPPLCNMLKRTTPVLSYSKQAPVLRAAAII